LSETLIPPDATDAEATILELDELWSFVLKKTHQAWIWIALCRKMRQVVAYASREIEVKKPAVVCGKPFLKPIVQAIATLIFGKLTRQ
jgi:hypothetical protein